MEYKEGLDFDSYDEWILIDKQKYHFFANYESVQKDGVEIDWEDPDYSHDKYFDSILYARIRETNGNRYAFNFDYNEEKQEIECVKAVYLTPQEVQVDKGKEFYRRNKKLIDTAVKGSIWFE